MSEYFLSLKSVRVSPDGTELFFGFKLALFVYDLTIKRLIMFCDCCSRSSLVHWGQNAVNCQLYVERLLCNMLYLNIDVGLA